MNSAYERIAADSVRDGIDRLPRLIHIIVGPRQVGKTTIARAIAAEWPGPVRYAAADLPLPPEPEWIETHWELARKAASTGATLLVLDEIQKVSRWSEVVKALWDDDRHADRPVRVLLLGSSAMLLSEGTSESLAGRFFLHRCLHWSFEECRDAFGWDLDQWVFFGGYPGAATLIDVESMWRGYVTDSLVEPAIARDVLAMQRVTKPALLRQLFILAARYPAQIVSYNKLLGLLQDAGNTTTLAHYLDLLETAFLVTGLQQYSAGQVRRRGSSPKLVLWNNALVSALNLWTFASARENPSRWGRLVENAVGAHLLNHLTGPAWDISYWRHRNNEVDFVISTGGNTWALEVKSGRPERQTGLAAFRKQHPTARALVVGTGGMTLEEFFCTDPVTLFS